MTRYTLPYPPSVNHYWRSIGPGRVVISKAGRDYRQQVWALARETGQPKLSGRLAVTIAATMPDRRGRDIDNVLKALLDALTHGGAWQDDKQIDDLRIYRTGIEAPGRVVVEVAEYEYEALPPRWALDHCS